MFITLATRCRGFEVKGHAAKKLEQFSLCMQDLEQSHASVLGLCGGKGFSPARPCCWGGSNSVTCQRLFHENRTT